MVISAVLSHKIKLHNVFL